MNSLIGADRLVLVRPKDVCQPSLFNRFQPLLLKYMKTTFNSLLSLILVWLLAATQACQPEEPRQGLTQKSSSPTANARAATGKFEIVGKQIFDPDGNEFVPIGANINTWVEKPSNSDADVQMIKTIWNFNIVRVSLHLDPGQYYAHLVPTDALLDSYVNTFTSTSYGKKVVVMFEMHDKSGGYYTDTSTPSLTQLKDTWVKYANRYKNNPYVWFNIMNEPGYERTTVSPQWKTTHETCISAIRATGNQNVIVCDGSIFGIERFSPNDGAVTNAQSAILTYGPGLVSKYANLLFSFHVYCPWNNSQSYMTDYVDRVQNAGLALIAGEYGALGGENCSNANSLSYFLNVLVPRKVGRLAWHYVGWDGNNIVNGNGRSGTDISVKTGAKPPVNSGDGSLTTLGSLLWDDSHRDYVIPGIYKIVSQVSTGGSPLRCLDVDGAIDVNNRNVQIYQDNGNLAQRWNIQPNGDGFYKITAQVGSKTRILDAANGGRGNGANVSIYDPWNPIPANRLWRIEKQSDGFYKLTSKASYSESTKYCLDVNGGVNANLQNVQLYQDNGQARQRWRLDKM